MKVLDIFSGIGGFSLGLERAGMETVAFCEIDPDCRKVLKKHWPDIFIHEDISKIDGTHWEYECVDLICGGYPCTGHSVAGKKEGFKNEQSNLWSEYERIIGEIRPKYIIIENSPNLRNTGLNRVIHEVSSLGYVCEWSVISAYSVGFPHQRKRLYIVCWQEGLPYCDPFRPWRTDLENKETKSLRRTKAWIEGYGLYKQTRNYKPSIRRKDNGISRRLDENRIKQLGNAVVPQIAQLIGERIMEYERTR